MPGGGLIEKRIRLVMEARRLTQQDLADLIGSSLSRVKAMTTGRVARLKPDEIRALVEDLHVSADWLATGKGAPFRRPVPKESADEFAGRMRAINLIANLLDAMPLPEAVRDKTRVLITGDPEQDGKIIAQAFDLPPDEAALLDNYRNSHEAGKDALRRTAIAFAQQKSA